MLHLVNSYGFDEAQGEHERKNMELHDQIGIELTELGRAPWMVARDWNMTPDKAQECRDMGGTCVRTFQATE